MRYVILLVVFSILGCGFLEPAAPPPTQFAPAQPPAAPPYKDRVTAVADTVERALKLDGTPKARQVADRVFGCTGGTEACANLAGMMQGQSKVGALAGMAANLVRRINVREQPDMNRQFIEEGEKLAKRALEEAGAKEAQADAQQAQAEKAKGEHDKLVGAVQACEADPRACRSKCDGGDGTSCGILAAKANQEGKLVEAQALATKGCKLGAPAACRASENIAAGGNALWSDVQEVGDDLAQKYHQTAMVAKMRPGVVPRMKAINAAILAEKYCPARKAFVQQLGAAEFSRRAAAHCKDEPPTGQGLSGAEVTLTAQCSQVYASACP